MHNVSGLTGFIGLRDVRQFRYADKEGERNTPAGEPGWRIENAGGVIANMHRRHWRAKCNDLGIRQSLLNSGAVFNCSTGRTDSG